MAQRLVALVPVAALVLWNLALSAIVALAVLLPLRSALRAACGLWTDAPSRHVTLMIAPTLHIAVTTLATTIFGVNRRLLPSPFAEGLLISLAFIIVMFLTVFLIPWPSHVWYWCLGLLPLAWANLLACILLVEKRGSGENIPRYTFNCLKTSCVIMGLRISEIIIFASCFEFRNVKAAAAIAGRASAMDIFETVTFIGIGVPVLRILICYLRQRVVWSVLQPTNRDQEIAVHRSQLTFLYNTNMLWGTVVDALLLQTVRDWQFGATVALQVGTRVVEARITAVNVIRQQERKHVEDEREREPVDSCPLPSRESKELHEHHAPSNDAPISNKNQLLPRQTIKQIAPMNHAQAASQRLLSNQIKSSRSLALSISQVISTSEDTVAENAKAKSARIMSIAATRAMQGVDELVTITTSATAPSGRTSTLADRALKPNFAAMEVFQQVQPSKIVVTACDAPPFQPLHYGVRHGFYRTGRALGSASGHLIAAVLLLLFVSTEPYATWASAHASLQPSTLTWRMMTQAALTSLVDLLGLALDARMMGFDVRESVAEVRAAGVSPLGAFYAYGSAVAVVGSFLIADAGAVAANGMYAP